jgi:hypothetical protein
VPGKDFWQRAFPSEVRITENRHVSQESSGLSSRSIPKEKVDDD